MLHSKGPQLGSEECKPEFNAISDVRSILQASKLCAAQTDGRIMLQVNMAPRYNAERSGAKEEVCVCVGGLCVWMSLLVSAFPTYQF